jgi:hypothetical protein
MEGINFYFWRVQGEEGCEDGMCRGRGDALRTRVSRGGWRNCEVVYRFGFACFWTEQKCCDRDAELFQVA